MNKLTLSSDAVRSVFAVLLLLAFAPTVFVPPVFAQETKTKTVALGTLKKASVKSHLMSQVEKSSLSDPGKSKTGAPMKQAKSQGSFYLVFATEFTSAAARRAVFSDAKTTRIAGAGVLTVVDRFADVFIGTDQALNILLTSPGLVWIERTGQAETPPVTRTKASELPSKAVPEPIVRGGVGNLRGEGSVIAIVDSGLDFRHPDFIRYDASGQPTSRLLYLWDPTHDYRPGIGSPAPVKYPNGAPIGTIYTQAQLTAELRSGGNSIPATDRHGHGTACASVAAGSGNADFQLPSGLKRRATVGVAPEADLIGVGMGPGMEHGFIFNAAVEWLDTVAGTKPLVVSGSFGSHATGHDGQSIEERQLDFRFSPNRPGRSVVLAAGNEATAPIHAAINIGPRASSRWITWNALVDKAPLAIYFNDGDVSDVAVELPDGSAFQLGGDALTLNPITRQVVLTLPLPKGIAAMKLFSTSGRRLTANAYFFNQGIGIFSPDSASSTGLVGSPGTMRNSITVGSYDWNDNFHADGNPVTLPASCRSSSGGFLSMEISNISCYSSPGPTRDGRRKPEIAAPGQWFPSSVAKIDGEPSPEMIVDSTGNYAAMNGTSAATPYVAGVIALMYQKKPTLTIAEIKNLLRLHASRDPFTGNPPTTYFGDGKLDLAAVNRILAAL